jgi:hypothetical protein
MVAVQTMRAHARRSLAMQLRSKLHPATARQFVTMVTISVASHSIVTWQRTALALRPHDAPVALPLMHAHLLTHLGLPLALFAKILIDFDQDLIDLLIDCLLAYFPASIHCFCICLGCLIVACLII